MSAPRWLCHGQRPGGGGRGMHQVLQCSVAPNKGIQCSLMRLDRPIHPALAGAGTGSTGCHELAHVPWEPARAAVPGLAPADSTVPFPADPEVLPTPSAAAPVPRAGTSPSSQPGHSQHRAGHPVLGTDPQPGESGPSCGCGGTGEGAGGACPDALDGAGGASESSGWGWQGEGGRIKLARSSLGGAVGLDLER